ncbi:unnamed protein product [Camellia sinensis]
MVEDGSERENGRLSTMDSIESRSVFQDEDKSEIEDEEDDEDLTPRIGMDSDDDDNSEQRLIWQALGSIPLMSKHLRSPKRNGTTLREVHSKREEWEIDLAKLDIKNAIAHGTYGTVYRGTYDGQDVAEGTLGDYKVVFDAVYMPRKTTLLKEAEAAGAIIVSGVEMFLRQAIEQFNLFTGGKDYVGSKQSSSFEDTNSAKEKAKSIYPPIESHWNLPPQKEYKKLSSLNLNCKSMLSYPLKIRDSLKRIRKSQSLLAVPKEARDPKDDQIVQSFRELLLLEGHLPGKHSVITTHFYVFLRMRDFDLMKAKDMFLQYLKWREEFEVDTIVK